MTFAERWTAALRDRGLRTHLLLTVPALIAVMRWFASFLLWVEARPGVSFSDPLLAALPARDLTWGIFALLYVGLATGLAVLAFHPRQLVIGLQAYALMVLARMALMSALPLDPPAGMIALRDPLVEVLGNGATMTRDLFFSGHTATMTMLALAVPGRALKVALGLGAAGVAAGVLWQHVHYTVDVLVAPFVAFACYRAVRSLHCAAAE